MNPLRAIIVDDEPLAREGLRALLDGAAGVSVAGEYANGVDAVAAILTTKPDILFLDIQMPEMNGFDVLEAVKDEWLPAVIFVTAYDAFAVKAFEVHAVDYLLKPVDPERFNAALAHAKARLAQNNAQDPPDRIHELLREIERDLPARDRIPVRNGSAITLLRTDEIDWIEADREYVVLHTKDKNHLVRGKIGDFEVRLHPRQFIRIHRSIIVNIDRVSELVPLFSGEYAVTLSTGAKLRSGRTYSDALKSLIAKFA